MFVGFCSSDVLPSPKSHNHEVAFIEASVNTTVNGTVPDVGVPVNAEIGKVPSVTVI